MTFTKKVFFYSRRDTGGKLRIVVHRRARDGGRILRLLLMASARGTGEKSPPSPVPRVSAGAGEKSVRCRRTRAHSGAREAEGEEEDDILEPCWRKPRALSRYRPRGRGCRLPLRCGRSRRAQKRRGFFGALPAAGGTLPQPARRKRKELRGRRGCAGAGSSAERHVVSVLNARGRAGAAALLRHAGATLPSGVAWNKNAPAAEAPGRFVGRRRPFTSA